MGRKYLFVINSFLAGGAERSLLELLPRLVASGITPVIACLNYREVGFEEDVRGAGYDVRLLEGRSRLAKVRSLRRLITAERPDLVYTSLFDADLAGRIAAVGLDVPVMSNLANTAYDEARLADPNVDARRLRVVQMIDGWTARHLTDHFHAVSQAVKDSTVETLGVDPDRITVVKRGRDAARLGRRTAERRAAARETLGLDEAAEVVVTVGRQEYQKGHRYLIEAWAKVVADRPRAHLLIAGREGHVSQDLTTLIDRLGLGETVTLLGHRRDVPEILAAADVFVFPSLYEGLGGGLIEALALDLPIIASDLPAHREVVAEGENADLVPPADVAALHAALVALLADEPRRARYARRSRELFDAEFHVEDVTDQMVTMLAQVAISPGPTAVGDEDLTSILGGMHDRRESVADDLAWSVAGRWRSFKADFVRATSAGGDVAVKFGDGWTPDDARFVSSEIERVHGIFEDLPGGRVDVPRSLGWSAEPAAVALRYVEGPILFSVLGDPDHQLWERGGQALVAMVALCGQAIGAYHSAEPATDDAAIAEVALADLLGATRRAGVPRRTILAVEPHLLRARGYRFSPNDFIVDGAGGLVMLDPPHVRKYDYIHRDLSAFTFELHRALIGPRALRPDHPHARLLGELRRAFLDGYAKTGPSALDSDLDSWMIRFYEVSRISGFVYARIRRRSLAGAVPAIRWAAQVRRGLGAPPVVRQNGSINP